MNELDEYYYTVRSNETRKTYEEYFHYLEKFSSLKVAEVMRLPLKQMQELLIKYVIHMRDRKLSSSSIKGRLAPVFSILELNDILVNKKRVLKFIGESKKTVKDMAYTTQDIEHMVSVSKPRTRLIILMYASTGIRRSALLELKLKHLEKLDEPGIYKFVIYQNSAEEYITYCTPECTTAIEQYVQYRKESGEDVNSESWLIRNDFDPRNEYSVKNPKQTSAVNINSIIRNVLIKIGLRNIHQPQKLRNEKSTIHAFRKFTTTQFVNSNLNPEMREMLLGHSIGLTGVYYRPSEQTILSEYIKAIDNLTINPTFRLKRKIKLLEGREREIEQIKQQHEKDLKTINKKYEDLIDMLKINPSLLRVKTGVLRKLEKLKTVE